MSGLVFTIIFVPLVVFLVIVMPTWLVLHYRDKQRQSRELSVDEWHEIEQTLERAGKLEERIATLELILDAEHKGWRNQQ